MKITAKPKVKEAQKINWRELPIGTIVRFTDDVTAMVFSNSDSTKRRLLLLNYTDGTLWLREALGYKTITIAEVLGVLTEMVVE